jgi:hypothetical protein
VAGVFGGSSTNASQATRYTQMQVQTSAQGLPVPLIWGTARVSPNLFWYGDFNSEPVNNGKGGGKGGAKGGSTYTYSAAVMMGLCEGPLTDMHANFPGFFPNANTFIGKVWRDQAQLTTLANLNLTPFQGSASQATWSYLTTNYPSQAIPYSSLAYVASPKYSLGYSPALPNHSFEVFSDFAGSYTAVAQSFTPSGNPPGMAGAGTYTDSTHFPGVTFSYLATYNNVLLFSPGPGGYSGAGTLTRVSGTGPASIAYAGSTVANPPVLDANPADIVNDFLTNGQYSIGLLTSQIDSASLAFYRQYCAAQGIFLSPVLDTQEQVSQTVDRWASLTNTLIFWGEGVLKFVPLGDSAITNTGVTPNVSFTPNLTIAYDLTYDDFLDTGKQNGAGNPAPPISVTRIDPADAPNHVKIEIKDRANAYNAEPVEWQDQGLVDQYGQIDSPVTEAHEVCDLTVAAIVVQLVGQRLAYIRNTYAFTLGAEFSLLEPGDILTLSDPHLGLNRQPVRIRTIDEDDKYNLAVVAEEFPGSLGTALAYNVQQGGNGGGYDTGNDPGDVNPPCIFEPSSALTNGVAQIWISASGGANWGGSAVLVSFDDVTYTPAGYIGAPSPQGTLVSDFPAFGGGPGGEDTADTLTIDLTESGGVLPTSATNADADAYRTLCLIGAAFAVVSGAATIPNTGELIAYGGIAQGSTPEQFLLGYSSANPGAYIRRDLYGMGTQDHPTGSNVTRIELTQQQPPLNAILIYDLPAQYIGKTIWFKFLSFNTFGNALQDPSTVVAYSYTTTGAGYGGGTGGVPMQPTGLTATGVSGGIALAWNANPPTDNVTSYTLYRDASPIWSGLGTAFTDTNVVPGVSHTYTLTATNAAGTSVASSGATAAALTQIGAGRSIIVPSGTSSVTLLASDNYVGITNENAAALTINLPATPATNQDIRIADEYTGAGPPTQYGAGTYNWTIKSGGTPVMNGTVTSTNGGLSLHWNGTFWQQVY